MTQLETVLYDVQDHVAQITFNRPNKANTLNMQLGSDFYKAVMLADADPDVRAVLITGNGRFFSAGGDLSSFAAIDNLPAHIKEVTIFLHGTISRLARMDAPVIAAVNGAAGGAGMSIACACDLVYAAESSFFTMAYTAAGLAPDGSSTYFLPRIVGYHRALELALTNRRLSPQEAMDWGIVNRVLSDDELLSEAQDLAKKLAAGPTRAYGAAKKLLRLSWTESLETQMENEAQAISAMSGTADGQEGIHAFLEKRPANFKGE